MTAGLSARDLRRFVASRLPEFMVPSAFVVLDRLPLAPNGKLDHKALPDPEFTATTYRAPRTAVEETLAAVYADVLGLERVGLDDDFFAVGGDSIRSIQVVTRARAQGIEVSPRQIFEQRTVAELADRRHQRHRRPPGPRGVRGRRGGRHAAAADRPLHARTRRQLRPVLHVRWRWNCPSDIDAQQLTATLTAVLDRHDILRSRLLREDGGALHVEAPGTLDAASLVHRVVCDGTWSDWQERRRGRTGRRHRPPGPGGRSDGPVRLVRRRHHRPGPAADRPAPPRRRRRVLAHPAPGPGRRLAADPRRPRPSAARGRHLPAALDACPGRGGHQPRPRRRGGRCGAPRWKARTPCSGHGRSTRPSMCSPRSSTWSSSCPRR